MAIKKEFWCPAHGDFESETPVCPSGCTVAERHFRTAPAFHNGVTSRTDELIRSQVEAFGLSNIKTNVREGESVKMHSPAESKQMEFQKAIRSKYPSNWGAIAKGGTFNAKTQAVEGGTAAGGAVATVAQHGAEAANVIEQAGLRGAKHGYEYVKDPSGLKVDVSKAA